MPKHRMGRVNEEVMRELADLIRQLKDPRIPAMVSVVRVEVTPDLKFAKAHISVLGDEQQQKDCIKGLQSATGFIRREISHRINLRNTPEFHFVLDHSVERGAHIAQVLKGLNIPEETPEEEQQQEDRL